MFYLIEYVFYRKYDSYFSLKKFIQNQKFVEVLHATKKQVAYFISEKYNTKTNRNEKSKVSLF